MVIATGHTADGRPLLVLGLEEGNLERLRKGHPIYRDFAEFGAPDKGVVMVVWGNTAADIEADLRKVGALDGARRIAEGGPS